MPQKNRTVTGVLGGVLGLVGLSVATGVLVTATITPAIAVSGTAASQAIALFDSLPSYLKVEPPMSPSKIYAIDAAGNEIELAAFFDQNRAPINYDQISPTMIDAVISSEDKGFFDHSGIDIGATAKALVDNLRQTSTRGASTITQQFVKNVLVQQCEREVPSTDPEFFEKINECWVQYTQASGQEGIQRKLQELRYALQIDKDYPKHEILLGYLNVTHFGGTVYGIEAAANYYFGTTAQDLTISQAATLAGMVQNPNTFRIDKPGGSTVDANGNPRNSAEDGYAAAKERRDYVLERMLIDGKISQAEYDEAKAEEIVPNLQHAVNGCAVAGPNAYFCQYVKRVIETDPAFGETNADRQETLRRGGLKIYTTLDVSVQEAAVTAMQNRIPTAMDNVELGAAGVTVEASSGRILAMTQNTIFTEREDQKDLPGYTSLVYAADQQHGGATGFEVGSTYKLFTLIAWLEADRSLNEMINGLARNADGSRRIIEKWYCNGELQRNTTFVGNFGQGGGSVNTVIDHTRTSLNTAFLDMASQLDHCEINRVAERLGVRLGTGGSVTEENHFFDPAGSKNIAPLAMASAFATVANGGFYCTPKAIDKVIGLDGEEHPLPQSSCERVIDAGVAAGVAYALTGVLTTGTAQGSRTGDGIPQFGKTGTHEKHQTWMVSSSTTTTTATWVGNSIGQSNILDRYYNGSAITTWRHVLARAMQLAANARYGGSSFPSVDPHYLRTVHEDIPDNIIGMNVIEATEALEELGFAVNVDPTPVDSPLPEGLVAAHSPGVGQAVKGTQVTLFLSNGKGMEIPELPGSQSPNAARTFLLSQGLTNVTIGECTEVDPDEEVLPVNGRASGTNPAAGTVVAKNAPVSVLWRSNDCP